MKAIEIEQVSVYYDQVLALDDISFQVNAGDFIGIRGPNGGGKSTLMKAILGFVPLNAGKIKVFGEDPGKYSVPIGYVPQFSKIDRKFPVSVAEVVEMGRMKQGISPWFHYTKKDKQIAEELMYDVGIDQLKNRQIGDLSGGEFQKMLIARALAVQPKLLLLDEPTASLDSEARNEIYHLLSRLNQDITILMITHDMDLESRKINRIITLNTSLQ